MTSGCDGLVLIDKPSGPTSHDVVARVRRALGGLRVGHTGTLDPPATGLLVLVLGRATRLARYVPREPKAYSGVLALGLTTTTDDVAGDVLRRHEGVLPSEEEVAAAASRLIGRQMQVPPAVSAKQVGGERLYRLARRGQPVDVPGVEVLVERFAVRPASAPDRWAYETVVSAGTYVRAAVRDLGQLLGCGAAVVSLRRTSIGPLRVEDALPWFDDPTALGEAVTGSVVPLDRMPLDLDDLTVEDDRARRLFASGVATPCPDPRFAGGCEVAVRTSSGVLLGVGDLRDGTLRPRVVLVAA